VLRMYRESSDYTSDMEGVDGSSFEVLLQKTGEVMFDYKVREEKGGMWQGKIVDGKVFREGYREVTQESVRRLRKV